MAGYIDPGIATERSSKGFQDFFARWGAKANLRSIWNFIVPVAVVDRFRGDDEGSIYGISAETPGDASEHSSIFLGSWWGPGAVDNLTIEILAYSASINVTYNPGAIAEIAANFHIFTPYQPYNPTATLDPPGYFTPGLFTNKAFTRGGVIAVGGYAPTLPPEIGWMPKREAFYKLNAEPMRVVGAGVLPEPIRLYPGTGLAFQFPNPYPGALRIGLTLSVLYRARPIFL
jgi:hypothetical protein